MLAHASPIAKTPRLSWFKSGLFWRTFLLLGLLTTLSMASWIGMINAVQRGPQVKQTAELVVSVVTITKAALTHSAPELRKELPELLWLGWMGIVLFWVYDHSPDQRRTRRLIDGVVPLIDRLVGLSRLRVLRPALRQILALIETIRRDD